MVARLLRGVSLLAFLPCIVVAFSSAVPTVDELRSIAAASSLKVRGSTNSLKAWRYWSDKTIQLIRSDLEESLPVPVDKDALDDLSFQLGVAADVGTMPSFEHEGARAGYAINYFCRAALMSDLLFTSDSNILEESVDDLLGGSAESCRISSLGGGPGFDFVAATLLATYRAQQRETLPPTLHAIIFDYEEGWSPLVNEMAGSVQNVLGGAHSCDFGKCDITLPLYDPVNAQCQQEVDDTDIWFCSYCVAENAQKLRDTDYIFFRELFSEAKDGTVFVFTETTHRLWPELAHAAGDGFDVSFPSRFQKELGKRQMVLLKREGAVFGEEEKAQCLLFERDSELHERRMQNGTLRQVKKVRGAK